MVNLYMKELIELTQNISASTLLSWFVCMAGIIAGISAASIKIYNVAQKWHKFENKKEEHVEILEKNQEKIIVLENKIDTLIQAFATYTEEDKKDKQTLFRNNIQEIYNKTLKKRYITADDQKNYSCLVNAYTRNGGNSYILEDVVPWMKTVPVFSTDEDAEEYYKEHGTYN